MKKWTLIGVGGLALLAVAGGIVFYSVAANSESGASKNISERAAQSLQSKIDEIKKAADNPNHKPGSSRVQLSESELESYVFYSLKDDIPAHIDSFDVRVGE